MLVKRLRLVIIVLIMPLATMAGLFPSAKAATSSSFTFAAAGDFGGITSGTNGYSVLQKIKTSNPNFAIALGDLGYNSTNPKNWCNGFKSAYPNLVLVTGNHDTWNGGNVHYADNSTGVASDTLTSDTPAPHGFLDTSSGYVSACKVPSGINWVGSNVTYAGGTCSPSWALASPSCYGREYYFDYPSSNPIMRFIFISAGIGGSWAANYNVSSVHYNWLKGRIDDAKNTGLWVAVVTHKNCISDGSDFQTCESTFDPFNLAVTEMGGVDLWLNGHDHTYQRSHQLSNAADACTKYSNKTVSCVVLQEPPPGTPYFRGSGTVVNIIGTGGVGNDQICSSCSPTVRNQFASLCGSLGGGQVSPSCNNDYGFSQFQVSTNSINATYISATGTFRDTYLINVPNPPGDFAVAAGPVPVSRAVIGQSDTWSSRVVYVNSFGGFGGSSGLMVTLSSSIIGPSNICPGLTCPVASLVSSSVVVYAGSTVSSGITISTKLSTPCNNPTLASFSNIYSVNVTATYGSTHRSYAIPLYVYGRADITKQGNVDVDDMVLVAGAYGSSGTGWDLNKDLNNDTRDDVADLAIVTGAYNRSGC